ncbi:MAG: hypothetical protein OXU62_07195 [Gammaproteobacteria bacterium]|nr:hypothetical protein [Gammaproteobacteria bacterium]
MIYLAFACFCVFFVFCWLQNREAKKHDSVLFPFCQLRRDVMRYRYEAVMGMRGSYSRGEREALRRLSRELDETIHNYKKHKTVMFNLRKIIKYIQKYRHTLKQAAPIEMTDNHSIQKFHARFAYLLARACVAYTPLIRWELALRLMVFAGSFIWRIGKMRMQYILRSADTLREYGRRHVPEVATA